MNYVPLENIVHQSFPITTILNERKNKLIFLGSKSRKQKEKKASLINFYNETEKNPKLWVC